MLLNEQAKMNRFYAVNFKLLPLHSTTIYNTMKPTANEDVIKIANIQANDVM